MYLISTLLLVLSFALTQRVRLPRQKIYSKHRDVVLTCQSKTALAVLICPVKIQKIRLFGVLELFGNFVDQYMSFIMRRKMEYSFCASSVDAKLGKVLCHNALLHTAKGVINGNNIFRAGCNIPTVYPEIFVEVFEGITAHIICGYIQDGNLVVVTNVVEGDANIASTIKVSG